MKRLTLVLGVGVALVWGGVVLAHEGHEHAEGKVKGTVVQVHMAEVSHIEVKTTHGETVVLTADSATKYVKGDTLAALSDVKVGMRIIATVTEDGQIKKASEVQLGSMDAAAAHVTGTPHEH